MDIIKLEGNIGIVNLQSQLSVGNISQIVEEIRDMDVNSVLINLKEVENVNSNAMTFIILLIRRFTEMGLRSGVIYDIPRNKYLLEYCKINTICELFETESDSIIEFAKKPEIFSMYSHSGASYYLR